MYLNNVISTSEDPEVHFKFIESCIKNGNLNEVQKVIRTSNVYDPERVKAFLKTLKLTNPMPMIYLCDKHKFFADLAEYLFKNNFQTFLENYIKQNTTATPIMISTVLGLSPDESTLRVLTNKLPVCDIGELVKAYETHNKIKLLTGWLETRKEEGNVTPAVHTALAKIYIDSGNIAVSKDFLMNNQHYDCKEVGHYCEEKD